YGDDDVSGLALMLIGGGGIRARVSELVVLSGGAALELGAGLFGSGLGTEPQLGLTVHGGVEFSLR
ncbi:MAG: hypothetical protein AAGC55_33085, partial [Myxococcota bacterium]